ncbi:MAG: FtsX-like permease family protein [Dehalococcoidales bacterium]|jgi:putative ABC transport system permease protein|nr:FtsX-like permease family protein [Dehalococcoidales bacterium]NLT27845.1 FtsX-like permease family protein [Dehalococcoidales bacterium]
MVSPILSRSIWKYFFKHWWVILLSIIGVSIGVAVVVAIDIANTSAQKAFEISVENVTGTATHQITGGPLGMDEYFYTELIMQFPEVEASPVVEGYIKLEGETIHLMGLDIFSSSYMTDEMSGTFDMSALALLVEPRTVLIPYVMADRMDISTGDMITVSIAGSQTEIKVIGNVGEEDDSKIDGLLVADISTSQELLGKTGVIDHISLVVAEDEKHILTAIENWLPVEMSLISTVAGNESTLNMTDAFRTNLTAMSMLALLVGMFLIYNTMTFSVLQRRGLLGSLRVLGATRREIFSEVLIEAFVISVIGTGIGVILGVVLGQGLVKLVAGTIDSLYFTLTVTTFEISSGIFIKGILLGVITSLVASFIPAFEAAASRPQIVRFRSVIESLAQKLLPKITLAGLGMIVISVIILFLSSSSLIAGFASLFLLVIGFALCVPMIAELISKYLGIFMNRVGSKTSVLYKMAVTGIAGSISRTGTAIAAMVVAISVVIGMGIMIDSFRTTVQLWMQQAIQGDVYINTMENVSSTAETPLPYELVEQIVALDGIEATKGLKTVFLITDYGTLETDVITPVEQCRTEYQLKTGNALPAWESLKNGEAVYISEPLAYKNDLSVGDAITFTTEQGKQEYAISGIYYDYSSDAGKVIMAQSVYIKHWHDDTIASLGLYLENTDDKDAIMTAVKAIVADAAGITVTDSFTIRGNVLDLFDRTFLITRVLEFLAIIVAFIGILSALMAYQLEKIKEIGILRAAGVTPRQIWGMTGLQTGLMGAISGILAIPLGIFMSIILIQTINIRSFGWSIQMSIGASTIIEAMAIAIVASLLASVYPSWKMSKISPAEALREE